MPGFNSGVIVNEGAAQVKEDSGNSHRAITDNSPAKQEPKSPPQAGFSFLNYCVTYLSRSAVFFFSLIVACAAASRAIGTRKGEQET